MSELIPVGIFELYVFRLADDPSKYAVHIASPPEFIENVEAWIEAAACLSGFVARHTDLGYEMMLEVITARTMNYRDNPPPNRPVVPDSDVPNIPNDYLQKKE